MFKGIKRSQVIWLLVISIALSGLINIAVHSFAAISLTVSPVKPKVNGLQIPGSVGYTAAAGKTASVQFQATGDSTRGVGVRIIWKRSTSSTWCNFATTEKSTPFGVSSPCAHAADSKLNIHGWKNVDSSGTIVLASSGTTITFPAVDLPAGTYNWAAQSVTRDSSNNYYYGEPSVWTSSQTLTIVDPADLFNVPSYYNVTANVNPTGGGSVAGAGTIIAGSSKTLTANPASGYNFNSWSGDCSGTSKSYTLTVINSNKFCTANFTKISVPPVPQNPVPQNPSPPPPSNNSVGRPGATEYIYPELESGRYNFSDGSDSEATSSTDNEAPTKPENLKGEYVEEESAIHLDWDEATDNNSVSGYEIECQEKGTNAWTVVGNVVESEFKDFEFAPDKTYIYQVAAYDGAQNKSTPSDTVEVSAGAFKANVTLKEGGSASDSEGKVTIDVPKDAVTEDLVIIINKVKVKGISLPKGTKIVGNTYEILAKNSQGVEVKNFSRQISIRFNYKKINLLGISKSSLKIGTTTGEGETVILTTSLDGNEASTLSDHLSLYYLTAAKSGFWSVLLWTLLILMVIGGITAAGYYGWVYYKRRQYQEEHKEDFIFKH